jgi:Na+-transporting methylmalonyl-CoA/oxaloacetate decarboxylase gamma subunit
MEIDWGFAGQIGGFGFGLVFAVLIILAIAIWLVGLVLRRFGGDESQAEEEKKGE